MIRNSSNGRTDGRGDRGKQQYTRIFFRKFSSKYKSYNFFIKKTNFMFRKITLFQSASMCWAIISPTIQNPLLVRSWRANIGPTLVLNINCWNFSVGPMLGQCQHVNNDALPITLTITKRWPNDCLLSGSIYNWTLRRITMTWIYSLMFAFFKN